MGTPCEVPVPRNVTRTNEDGTSRLRGDEDRLGAWGLGLGGLGLGAWGLEAWRLGGSMTRGDGGASGTMSVAHAFLVQVQVQVRVHASDRRPPQA
jgi:hypothetical protein